MTSRNGWQPISLKRVVDQIDSGVSVNAVDSPRRPGEVGVLKTSCVSGGSFDPSQNKAVVEDEISRVTCPVVAGRIIVSRMNTPQLVGAAGFVSESVEGLYLPDRLWQVSITDGACAEFLSYWMLTKGYRDQVASLGVGTSASMKNISQDDFRNLKLVIPPLDEQRAIADYLGRETYQIDALIKEQQRLIELLRERKAAQTKCTLTRGLGLSPALQDSGVMSLGLIPRHWRIVPSRYLCEITTGSKDSGNATEDGRYPFYVRGREILRIGQYSFDCEAVMTPGDGQGGVGKVFHYANGRFEAHQRVYVFKDFKGIGARYFFHFLSTFLAPVALAGNNKVTMESLRRPMLADLRVPVPPPDEQRRIVNYLDDHDAKIDTLVAETERFIELSRERRAALITAAVTGQIDVGVEAA